MSTQDAIPAGLDARLALLREAFSDSAPPTATDRAIALAIDRVRRRERRRNRYGDPLLREGWLAWPLALAASIAAIAFFVRADGPDTANPSEATLDAAASVARSKFMPVVPIAEIERAGDALLVPARLPRTTIAQFGLPIDPARAADDVNAELLVRRDGALLAVRFVN